MKKKNPKNFRVYVDRSAAVKAAAASGGTMIEISNSVYLVGEFSRLGLDEIRLVHVLPDGDLLSGGEITLRHLDRLGNANHASASPNPMWKKKQRFWEASGPKEEG